MYKKVKYQGFNHRCKLLHKHFDGESIIPNAMIVKENRKLIQVYLFKIQSRVNRGFLKGALQLLNRLIDVTSLPYWAVCALKQELNKPVLLAR